jgi:hypothetical protein
LAQTNSDPFPGHIPARLRPLGSAAEHTARADSDPSVQSRHMTLTTATPPGPGYIPPARVHAPAARGQAQSSKSPMLRTQQATEGVRRCYYDTAYVGARLKLYVQRTLERSCTGRATQWRPLFGTQCRPTCWVRTPSASHRYVSTHLRQRLPNDEHIRATSEGASSISRGSVLAHCRGFGTFGWTDVGDPSTRSRLWPWRHGSRELLHLLVCCPSTLARGVGPLRFGPTWSPVLRIRDIAIL